MLSRTELESEANSKAAVPLSAVTGTSRIEAVLARIFIAILAFIVFFAVAELISRHYLAKKHSPIEDEFPSLEDVRHPMPYVMFGALPFARNFNELGYRGKAPKVPKNPSEFRIFMLGGSTVLLGKPPIAGWLESEFADNGHPNVKVYNYGVISSVSGMELARIVYEISDLQPDLIIMYNGGNDILMPYETDPRPGYPYNFVVMESNPIYQSTPGSYPAFALFAYGSNLLRYFLGDQFEERFLHIKQLRKDVGVMSDPWRDKIAESYVSNLVRASRVSAAFGSEFIAFFQPLVYYKKNLTEEEQNSVQNIYGGKEETEFALDMRNRIVARLNRAAKTSNLNWLNLSHIYENKTERVFTDEIHTTDPAKHLVANAMYKRLESQWGQKFSAPTTQASQP